MADKKNKEEEVEEKESTKPKESKKKSPKGPMMILLGAVVAILVLGGGGFFLWSHFKSADAAEETVESGEEITETNIYYEGFPTNIVNLAVSENSEFIYLKYNYILEVSNELVTAEVIRKQPRIIAVVDSVMSNRDWAEIGTSEGKERLAREAMRAINEELQSGEVIGLYFVTFVAQ